MTCRHIAKTLLLVFMLVSLMGATCQEIYTLNGTWYRVRSGDSLSSIADRFGASSQELAEINDLTNSNQLDVGERIFVPNNRRYYAARKSSGESGQTSQKPRRESEVVYQRDKFSWPVNGEVTSRYGIRSGRRHDGIDISADRGAPIHAADAGEVAYSSSLRGYGNLILVKHKNNFFTVYAHNARNLKKKGEKVAKGEIIARVGSSGRASGPHLHFEVREGSSARNPLFFLPKQGSMLAKEGGTGGP